MFSLHSPTATTFAAAQWSIQERTYFFIQLFPEMQVVAVWGKVVQWWVVLVLALWCRTQPGVLGDGLLPADCGRSHFNYGRIYGGQTAHVGEVPWLALLEFYDNSRCI